MASIKDVAKMAEVSISTVSLAMNYPERVREETKAKIFEAMKQLHYVPSASHRKLPDSPAKKTSVALICGEIFGPYYYEMLRGLSETIVLNGMEMIMLSSNDSIRRNFMESIENPAFCGIILTQMAEITPQDVTRARQKGLGVVMCHAESSCADMGSVSIDNYYIGKLVASHLLYIGYRKIGLLGVQSYETKPRAAGFIKTLKDGGATVVPQWNVNMPLNERSAINAMEELMEGNPELPEAFFCLNDEIALGVLKVLTARGVKIPQQVAVVGCDNIGISKFASPPLTTIAMPRFEVGMTAVNLLMRQIGGKPPENIVLNGKLVTRESCGLRAYQSAGAHRAGR